MSENLRDIRDDRQREGRERLSIEGEKRTLTNRLLDALPHDMRRRLARDEERMTLPHGKVLHRPGETIEDLYFPEGCMVSVTVTMGDGRTSEAGVAGMRDIVGVNAFMGGSETTQTEYVVQIEGKAIRIPAAPLLKAFDQNKSVRDVFLKYTQAMIAHISQNSACNRLHQIEQRYARWLLEVRDRIGSDDLRLTHEFISQMLGVRRPTVTETANKLQDLGLITIHRGRVRIADVDGLERQACECFRVVQSEYDRLLGAREESYPAS